MTKPTAPKLPAKAPEEILGKELLEKSLFLRDPKLGTVTDIIRNPTREAAYGVAGLRGAVFFKADKSPVSRVTFATAKRAGVLGAFQQPLITSHVQFVDVDGKGHWEFLNRGGRPGRDASLINQNGETRWTCGGLAGVNDMAAGDLNGDGAADFVVALTMKEGLRRVDKDGKQRWQRADEFPSHVEIVDIDGDGKAEIVDSNVQDGFTIRDANGAVIRTIRSRGFYMQFSLCRWPHRQSPPKILILDESGVLLLDFFGGNVGHFSVPQHSLFETVRGTLFRMKPNEQECLAVVTLDQGAFFSTSHFYIFNPERELIYHESIPHECAVILAVPSDRTGIDDLLVGGTNCVWKYSPVTKGVSKPAGK